MPDQPEQTPTTATSAECLQAAFAALLRGDTAERDRLCARGRALVDAEDKAARVERVLSVDFYVTDRGNCIPVAELARAGMSIQ